MRVEELPQLHARLNELADYYGSKQLSPGAMKVWLDVLKSTPLPTILGVLTDWPAKQRKMPLADEVRLQCDSRRSDEIEKPKPQVSLEQALGAAVHNPQSEIARRELTKIMEILASPKPHPRAWMDRMREDEADGVVLSPVQRAMLEEAEKRVFGSVEAAAYARMSGLSAVKPTADDGSREAAEERAAIQGEQS